MTLALEELKDENRRISLGAVLDELYTVITYREQTRPEKLIHQLFVQ